MERKLAAILAADVVGYSRLIGADETGILDHLRGLLQDVIEPPITRHHGRIVKLMGDGVLAEFDSVVDAVVAAVELQEAVPERSTSLPEEHQMALRVCVNLGDGVNIAARLQEVASSGGVAISDDVFRQLRGKLDLPFQDSGEKFPRTSPSPCGPGCGRQSLYSTRTPRLKRRPCRRTSPRSRCYRSRICPARQSRNSSPTGWPRISPPVCPCSAPCSSFPEIPRSPSREGLLIQGRSPGNRVFAA